MFRHLARYSLDKSCRIIQMKTESANFDIPLTGWRCSDVFDLRADGSSIDETEYKICEMCGNERLRFIHVMTHDNFDGTLNVGCVCAEKMSGDSIGPKKRQEEVSKQTSRRASQKSKWLKRGWSLSARGNPVRYINSHHVVVRLSETEPDRWVYAIDLDEVETTYSSEEEAKLALFYRFWPVTD